MSTDTPLLAKFENGLKVQGRSILANVTERGKGKKKGVVFNKSVASPAPPLSTIDLKVNHLPVGVAQSIIRNIFEGMNLSKVILKESPNDAYAFLGIKVDQAERVVNVLNGKKVGHGYIVVKVAERCK